MKNSIVSIIVSIIISALSLVIYDQLHKEKTGFVKSGVVINEYRGMKLANEQFAKELQQTQGNLDTLKSRYIKLKELESVIAQKDRADWAYKLGISENEYRKYEEQAGQQMEMRKEQLTKKVLEEVNNLIQDYGKKNKYKIIFGTTDDGSILYGNETDDITGKILELLNARKKDKGDNE